MVTEDILITLGQFIYQFSHLRSHPLSKDLALPRFCTQCSLNENKIKCPMLLPWCPETPVNKCAAQTTQKVFGEKEGYAVNHLQLVLRPENHHFETEFLGFLLFLLLFVNSWGFFFLK